MPIDPLALACSRILGDLAVLLSQCRRRLTRGEFERLLRAHRLALEGSARRETLQHVPNVSLEKAEAALAVAFRLLEAGVVDRDCLNRLEAFCRSFADRDR